MKRKKTFGKDPHGYTVISIRLERVDFKTIPPSRIAIMRKTYKYVQERRDKLQYKGVALFSRQF